MPCIHASAPIRNGSAYNIGWHGASDSYSAVKGYNISSMLIGDLHFYHWYGHPAGANHAADAVAYLSDGETLIAAHSNSVYHAQWDLGASGATYHLDRCTTRSISTDHESSRQNQDSERQEKLCPSGKLRLPRQRRLLLP